MPGNRRSIRLKNYDYTRQGAYNVTVCVGGRVRRGGSRTAPTKKRKPLGRLIGAFKTVSTKQINAIQDTPGTRLWQRNYYEHIIRNDHDLDRVREYVINNPKNWENDENYAEAI